MNLIRQLIQLFDRRDRLRIGLLMIVLFIGSLLEVGGIGLVLPFVKLVGDPDLVLRQPSIGPILARVGIESPRVLIISACVFLLSYFIFKALYVGMSLRLTYGFIYNRMTGISRRLLESYLRAPYLFHLQQNTAQLVKTATIETEHVGGILKFGLLLPAELFVVVGLLMVMLFTEPFTALLGLSVLGIVSWLISRLTRRRLATLGRLRADSHGRMIQWVNQSLGGIKEVKVLGREQFFVEATAKSGRDYARALRGSALLTQYPRVVVETVAGVLIVVLVLVSLLSGKDPRTLVGVLALFGVAMARLVPSASRVLNALNSIRFYAHSVTLVSDGLKLAKSLPSESLAASGLKFANVIEIQNLSYRYPGAERESIRSFNLVINRGERIAFVGASGTGKTTLANLILGLISPDSGRILVDGVDINTGLRSWQKQLGYIPQDIYLTDDTIRRNVAFGIPDEQIDDAAVWRALEAAQLETFVRQLKGDLNSQVGERGVRISAGQRQRVGIARALYHDPDVLVLDEATSALDNETERQFAATINALPRSKTVFIIAHRLATVHICDRVCVLRAGELAASGTFTALQEMGGEYRELLDHTDAPPLAEKEQPSVSAKEAVPGLSAR